MIIFLIILQYECAFVNNILGMSACSESIIEE